jgi:hypothetical protein
LSQKIHVCSLARIRHRFCAPRIGAGDRAQSRRLEKHLPFRPLQTFGNDYSGKPAVRRFAALQSMSLLLLNGT